MKNSLGSIISGKVPRPMAVPASPGVARYAKLGIPFLLAFALLVCWIAPGWCATDMTLSRPNAGAGPTRVNVYLYLVDVFEVSGSDQAFSADVVLIAEWRDPNLAGKWTAMPKRETGGCLGASTATGEPARREHPTAAAGRDLSRRVGSLPAALVGTFHGPHGP